MSSAIFYSVPTPAPKGLDTKRYVVSLVVERADRKPLTEADCALVERIYAKELASEGIEPSAKPKPTRTKTKRAAKATPSRAAKVARAPSTKGRPRAG